MQVHNFGGEGLLLMVSIIGGRVRIKSVSFGPDGGARHFSGMQSIYQAQVVAEGGAREWYRTSQFPVVNKLFL